jgi:hypothetical protein
MLCGTGHVVYTMLPIIYDIAIKNGIRPERPMAGIFHRQPDGHHRQPGLGGRGVAGGLPGQGAGRRPVIDFIPCCPSPSRPPWSAC